MKIFLTGIKKYILIAFVVIIVLTVGYFSFFRSNNGKQEFLVIKKGDFVQTVSVSGKVIPAKSVELGFNRSGKITSVPVIVGQSVGAGQIIAELDSHEARLTLESAKLALTKLTENGTTQGLASNYEDSLTSVNNFFIDLPPIFDGLDNILNNYATSVYKMSLPNEMATSYYTKAIKSYWQAKKSYDQTLNNFQKLNRPISNDDIAKITEESYQTILLVSQATKDSYAYTNYLYNYETNPDNRSTQMVTDRTNINTWIGVVNTRLSDLVAKRATLKNVPLDIKEQELAVEQYQKQYEDYFLRAPFTGVITRLDIKNGEQALAGQAEVSMISAGTFQIESFVPEINIATLKVGNPAQVTLDAYGPDVAFEAKVIAIDPAETIRDGVSTYKVKLQFNLPDSRIKSGMTANIILTTENKSNVISVPPGAIITVNNQKTVQIKDGEKIVNRSITVGSIGALGQAEVLSGLKEGEVLVLNPKTK